MKWRLWAHASVQANYYAKFHTSYLKQILISKWSVLYSAQSILVWFGLRFYVPVNNFSVMSGRSHRFLGITSTFWEVNVSCSRIQHAVPSEDRTPDLSLRSPMLYHYATAPPSAQSRNQCNSRIVLHKVGILTLLGEVRIPT